MSVALAHGWMDWRAVDTVSVAMTVAAYAMPTIVVVTGKVRDVGIVQMVIGDQAVQDSVSATRTQAYAVKA